MRWFSLLLATTLALPAVAAPLSFSSQGRLLDPAGGPLNGEYELTFGLYSSQDATTAEWSTTQSLTLEEGLYSVILSGFAVSDLDGDRWLDVAVDGVSIRPRQPIVSVPYAVIAGGVADNTATCNDTTPERHGSLRYHNDVFQGCTPEGWVSLAADGPDGSSPTNPGVTCRTLHADFPTAPSGPYWIAPGGTAVQTWCDMTPGDAGWSLVAHKQSNASNILDDPAQGTLGQPGVSTTHFKIHTNQIDELQAESSTWRIYGSVTGKETDISTTGLPASGWISNEYRQFRNMLLGRNLSGCGPDRWAAGEIFPVDGSVPSPSCYAYPTGTNFYDYKTNASGGNGVGQTIWLR